MSIQTGVYLEVLGLILVLDGAWRKPWVYVIDGLAVTLLLLVLTVTAGYAFEAAKLFGENAYTRVSPHTLTCMMLMGIAVIGRRARSGFLSVLAGDAVGSQSARIALPFGLGLPFLIVSGSALSIQAQWLSTPYAAALAASMCSGVIFVFVLLMAQRINALERGLRDMSLLDELTNIYNRRAFYLLGENALLEARRGKTPLTVLFFDLNGLKTVNDSLGHEIGSQLLVEAAQLLRASFRSGEVVARVGGDEFAVVTRKLKDELIDTLKRLDAATAVANSSDARRYRISYSMGEASIQPEGNESFGALVDRADALMYGRKRKRKVDRDAAAATVDSDTPIIDPEATGALAAYVAAAESPELRVGTLAKQEAGIRTRPHPKRRTNP